ncbi:MAG TPA: glycosyltransferase family 4 protein [Oscillospiraceae bacterium]|nr:glycosyltransferase family 4 protein [Oscillospiraceae bacterium]HPK36086.1 glycosyltransferase family 4 protein [Oscillospiraceae bacterium]HPR76497.1 glycosyltransferase family 4 protein [Oscillospiraceae bacterium]
MDSAQKKPKVLMTASVASMIDLFNMSNIDVLQSMGYEVHVAANFQSGNITDQKRVDEFKAELAARGIKVYDIPVPRNIFAFKKIAESDRMFRKIYTENQYRFVHCHSPIGGVLARLCARKVRKKQGTKMVYTAHGFHFFNGAPLHYWLFYFPIEWYCSFFTDVLITINHEDFRFAQKHLRAKKTTYVQGVGVDLLRFSEGTAALQTLRKELGIPEDAFAVITVGELSARKNQQVILKAIAASNRNIHYILVGFGQEEHYLRRLSEEFGITDRVHFLGYRSDVADLYHAADVFCFPSFHEGLSLSLMEAMASGLSVLCSDIRGNRDLIVDKKGGFLYAPTDVSAFAEGLTILVDDPSLRARFGAFNAERIRDFSSEVIGEKMRGIYREL